MDKLVFNFYFERHNSTGLIVDQLALSQSFLSFFLSFSFHSFSSDIQKGHECIGEMTINWFHILSSTSRLLQLIILTNNWQCKLWIWNQFMKLKWFSIYHQYECFQICFLLIKMNLLLLKAFLGLYFYLNFYILSKGIFFLVLVERIEIFSLYNQIQFEPFTLIVFGRQWQWRCFW